MSATEVIEAGVSWFQSFMLYACCLGAKGGVGLPSLRLVAKKAFRVVGFPKKARRPRSLAFES